jgi:hypothetical protein
LNGIARLGHCDEVFCGNPTPAAAREISRCAGKTSVAPGLQIAYIDMINFKPKGELQCGFN